MSRLYEIYVHLSGRLSRPRCLQVVPDQHCFVDAPDFHCTFHMHVRIKSPNCRRNDAVLKTEARLGRPLSAQHQKTPKYRHLDLVFLFFISCIEVHLVHSCRMYDFVKTGNVQVTMFVSEAFRSSSHSYSCVWPLTSWRRPMVSWWQE